MVFHIPVLKKEVLENLIINLDGVYLDCTFGFGGHSSTILEKLSAKGKLIAFDQDQDAIDKCSIKDDRFFFFNSNFLYFDHILEFLKIKEIDGIFFDLGVSSYQIDTPERGFSTRFFCNLDMRMNKSFEKNAFDVLNFSSKERLEEIFQNYGELSSYKKISSLIIEKRRKEKIKTSEDLIKILENIDKKNENKFFAQVFQAIRIEVNDELNILEKTLEKIPFFLKKEGRLVVISYHSLEDRIVKRFIKNGGTNQQVFTDIYGNREINIKQINKKIITPSDQEIFENKRSRSAKMRVAEKL